MPSKIELAIPRDKPVIKLFRRDFHRAYITVQRSELILM